MLESITLFTLTLATKLEVIAGATQAITSSLGIIVASIGASALSVSGMMAWISTVLPVPASSSGLYYTLHKYINVFGGNLGMAANALNKS